MSRIHARAAAAFAIVAALATPGSAENKWAGPYAGFNGGHGWGQASVSFPGDADGNGLFGSGIGNAGEASDGNYTQQFYRDVYGLYFGYNVQVWRGLIAGFEAAYNLTNLNAASKNPVPSVNFPRNTTEEDLRIISLFSLAPQVGYAWGRALLRMKGGIGGGRVASHLFSTMNGNNSPGPTEFGQDRTQLGWTWGGGIDFALTDHWIAGVAFDYYDIGTLRFGGQSVPDTNFPLAYEVHPVLRTWTLRLAYKFGGRGGLTAPREIGRPEPETETANDPHAALMAALSSKDAAIRAEAAVALGDLRFPDAVEPLLSALDDETLHVRAAAADALGKIGSKKALAPLSAQLQDRRPEIRGIAARALGVLGDSEALPALRKLAAKDADPKVRSLAAWAVKQLGR